MHVEPSTCPVCQKVFDPLRSRALTVSAGRVRAFCSEECRQTAELGLTQEPASDAEPPRATRSARRIVYPLSGVGLCALAIVAVALRHGHVPLAVPALPAAEAAVNTPVFSVADALQLLSARSDAQAGEGLPERDLWMHPLAGPKRRLPIRNTRRFGASRDGMRPDECREGHCGVDLGEEKGEWVFAAHDGVVERVVEDETASGGRYVRLNHRGGTLTTSYMHLETIRGELRPGVPVKAGDPLGTVGDTGIFHSGPHLHFQIGVRAHPGDLELFIDPEPLLQLWVLRPPLEAAAPRRLARSPRAAESGPQGM